MATKVRQAAPVLVFLSGLLAGSVHVLSGPDHLAAIAPLTLRAPRGGANFGAVWGLGHGGGVLLWLLLSSALHSLFGLELDPAHLEAAVGLSLMALGLSTLLSHRHAHREERHAPPEGTGRVTAFALGALHGSAGASHLFALVPTLGLPTHAATVYGAGYLGAGVLAMAGAGSLMGRLSTRLPDAAVTRRMCSALVFTLGAVWLLQALG